MDMKEYKKMYWRSIFNWRSTLKDKWFAIKCLFALRKIND